MARPYELDDATAALMLQVQSEDIDELLSAKKGKGREGDISDADLALAIYQGELQEMDTILADRSMGRSLTRAVITDAAILNESVVEENVAAGDRTLAHSLGGLKVPSSAPNKSQQHLSWTMEFWQD